MADDVDSDSDDEIKYSGMIQPPLIKQLQTILSDYPDDGQILKEIIQNAEDAGASEMKILYDGRPAVEEPSTKKAPFRQYFKGPALVVYNNAKFSEADWTGIKMLYSSIKEFDKTKVGRFGLGFKSVFHITDYPVIISGDQLLVLDPHQDSSKVCQTMKLKKLHRYKKMKVEDCLKAFSGVFGFDQNTLQKGHFEGTIFRFPLRQEETELSDNIYDKSKVDDLFMSFKDEAPVSLLFLKCLDSITLLREENESKTGDIGEAIFSVYIDETTIEEVRSARNGMRSKIQCLGNDLPSKSITNSYYMKICVEEDACTVSRTWKVMNLFQGENNMSSKLRKLSKDDSLSYSPYVGVAMDMDCPSELKGHVFCFLPLPLTEKSISGLPIHINGFFALSQSRRFVKWPTADQIRNHTHTDKSIQWNQALVMEVLSELYSGFLQELVEESSKYEDLKVHATTVSHCIPNANVVDEHWKILIPPLVEKLKNTSIFFTINQGGKWIQKKQAVFLRPNKIPLSGYGVESTIRRILEMYHQNIVEVDDHVWETMKLQGHTEVTPEFINRILRTSDAYTTCSNSDKFNLIRYLLSAGHYNSIEGLSLLPLQNGSFIKFCRGNNNASEIFRTPLLKMELLVGMENRMLSTLPTDVEDMFESIIEKGIYQIRNLQEHTFIHLMKETVQKKIGGGKYPIRWKLSDSCVDFKWLRMVWKCIVNEFSQKLDRFQDLPLVPEKVDENEYQMHALRENIMVGNVSKNISTCLDMLSIKVLRDLPKYISLHPKLNNFIPTVSLTNVVNAIGLLGQISSWEDSVELFNSHSSEDQKMDFLQFISKESQTFGTYSLKVLKSLKLFATQQRFVSIRENAKLLTRDLTVPYPSEIIKISDKQIIHFATELGAHELQDSEIFSSVLGCVLNGNLYNKKQIQDVMKYIIEKKIYNISDNLFQLVQNVPFVTTETNEQKTAKELFDPEDEVICYLISDRSQYPSPNIQRKGIKVLRKFGLKSRKDLTTRDIYDAAKAVHESSINDDVTVEIRKKQSALFKILTEREELLNSCIPGSDGCLKNMLMDMEIVRPFQTPTSPLPNMEWFRCNHFFCKPLEVYSSEYLDLVGYVAPVISSDKFPKLIHHLGWNRKPSLRKVLQQHSLYVDNYREEYKSEYLLPIKRLYTYLGQTFTTSVYDINVNKMWMGDGFVEPDQIYINRDADDIDVKPYIVPLPKEFETKNDLKVLAEHLGCKKKQTPETLVSILHLLKSKYETHINEMDCALFDMDIIIRILNKLKSVPDIEEMNVPIPIHSTNKSKLEFRVAKECNYCNAEWLKELAEEDGESMYFVHEDVSSDTASKLGVLSLTENLLSETEGIQEWGQKEPLTRRIKNLLKDYKDGFAVPKELVQNADDAKASKVCFLYDERENMDCRTRLIDENMISCHGPALWAFNDALFSQKDLENITKLSGATKAEDLTKVGKFGLGFCSVYNLTDVPSFLTGSSMVIFDPCAKYIGKAVKKNNPGLKIDLTTTKNKILLRRMKNQFKPFNGIFGCNLDTEEPSFNGSLFRFPFRTTDQAVDSEICDKAYNEQEIKSMIKLFVENAGNLLLFTQYVKEIEFYHLPKESLTNDPILLHRVCRKENSSKDVHILPTFGLAMKNYQQSLGKIPKQVLQTMVVTISTEMTQQCHIFCDSINGNSEANWFISWASGTTISLKMGGNMSHTAALPLASTALYLKEDAGILKCSSLKDTPDGFYKDSHIFCYLPLPVNSPFPLHINGSFAVSSNRRQLSSKTTDDKSDFENDWNEALLADAVVNAYIHLIENLSENNILCEQYQALWPILNQKCQDKMYFAFYRTFYDSVVQRDSKVFCGRKTWLPLSQRFFLEPNLKHSEIGQIASEAATKYRENEHMFLISLEKVIVDSYVELFGKLPDAIQSKIISLESFYLDIFLANIDDNFWSTDMIKLLIGFALDIQNEQISSKLKKTKCIPTLPNGNLKMPQELIKKNGKAASLFCDEDERFPSKEFESYQRLAALESLGMMVDVISDDLLIERITSVTNDAKRCFKCCIEKCECILSYIQEGKIIEPQIANRIRNIPFLPTLKKPNNWDFPWFLDKINSNYSTFSTTCSEHSSEKYAINLVRPGDLYMDTCTNLVGCEELIIDLSPFRVSVCDRKVLRKIGVLSRRDISLSTVIQQLNIICQHVHPATLTSASRLLLGEVCSDIYGYLDNALKHDPPVDMKNLWNVPCLFIDDMFVKPNQTAFTLPVKCSPKLYGLDRIQWKKNDFFLNKIGVKKYFEEGDVISVLKEMSELHSGELDQQSLDLACNLVQLLADVVETPVQREKYQDICIPDENGSFSPICALCLDDSSLLQKGKLLKFINSKIREADARKLGVQSKISGSLMQNYVQQLRPFGQKEELSSRIKRILKQYPLGEAVLKEMLQNADDAKASEVMFVTDFNTYGTEKTFDAKWQSLQGPALLIYNNSHFTDEDIVGIQQLGRGSKGDDPTKTGQYGVGFNAVYHITDVPSFLSISPVKGKETLCVMDPNCKYAPGANENSPGARFTGLNDLRKAFPDVFSCYHEDIFLQSPGTVFRLPLRTKTFADQSEISKRVVTEQIVKNLLQNLESEMGKSLLFLRNVKKITTASIENGKLCENNFTELIISDEHQKEKSAFDQYVVEKVTQFHTEREVFNTERKDVQYNVTLKRNSDRESRWCIIQTFGFNIDTDIPRSVQEAFDDDDLGLLPQGGVAMPLDTHALKDAAAFCFLPLPCKTGLTMHVNGHFSLDNESRRGLWKEDKKAYRTEWNNLLLCDVIAPIYAKALEALQMEIGLDSFTTDNRVESLDTIERFHSFFPNIDSASDYYWKDFVRAVYQYISRRKLRLFLSYHFVDRIDIAISCFSLHEENGDVLFVDTAKFSNHEIITIAKGLGAKLVDTPSWVCASIENAGVAIVKLDPSSFISFLKSPLCQIKMHIEENKQIELTMSSLKTSNHVKSCIEFCMQSENFIYDIDGLPLCLLETEKLVNFCTSSPVLLTSYSELIPKSKNKLLHHELHELLNDKKLRCIEEFHLPRLVELLPFHIDDDAFCHRICQWNPSQSDIPNKIWLRKLWNFLEDEVGNIRDQIGMKRILYTILPWSIVPTTKECIVQSRERTNEVIHELYPLEKANHVIDLSTFQPTMEMSLKKLELPVLDSDSLPITHPLHNLVASQERVYDVLECLLEHKKLIEDCNLLDINDCNTILDYFAGGLKQLLKMPKGQHCLTMLRKLPLFTTVHGNKINLEENRDILALPKGLPADGMNEWAKKTNKTLLRQNERLKCIFEHFNVTEQSIFEVYVVHILPYFHNIPEENRITHLQYIRDDLLKKSVMYDSAQNRLINALKKTPFLPKGDGTHKVASCFLSPFNELMNLMCEDPLQFPPKPFCSLDWKTFMTSVGMKTEITTDLFLEFARHQESLGRKGFSEKLEKKSKCLVHHLLHSSQLHTLDFLQQVSKIKFIVPCKIETYYTKICSHPTDDSNVLIAPRGSIKTKYLDTAWTQYRVLPYWVNSVVRGLKLSELGVQKPSKEKIVTHIQTVCKKLGGLSEKSLQEIGVEKISKIMKKFYEYANDKKVLSLVDIQAFQNIPFVFLSEFPRLFPCARFVLHLEEEYKMTPHLMPVPDTLFGFFTLFERFGATRKVSARTFANVLLQIRTSSDELNPNELRTAQKAMTFFFKCLSSEKIMDDQDLFLLSRSKKIVEAASLVFIDSRHLQVVLQDADKYFQIMAPIEDVNDEVAIKGIKVLPEKNRPKFISTVIHTAVEFSDNKIVENETSEEINDFFRSEEFIQGVLRLVCQECHENKKDSPPDNRIREIKENLCRTRMVFVSEMEKVYSYNNTHIYKQPCMKYFNCLEEDGFLKCLIYTNIDEESDAKKIIENNLDNICRAIRKCTDCNFNKTTVDLTMICLNLKSRAKIETILDEKNVPSLNNTQRDTTYQLPKPGDVLEIRWHSILDNAFISFEPGEYVAYLSGINKRGVVEYKYAIIKEKLSAVADENSLPFLQAYLVEVEPRKEREMKVYELYKFNRTNDPKDGKKLKDFQVQVLHEHERTEDATFSVPPYDNRALNEIFKEIRECLKHAFTLPEKQRRNICRRVMFRWHPDKNPNDVPRATTIFQYIRKIIKMLEEKKNIDEDDTKEPSNKSHPWSDDLFDEFETFYQKEKEYEERYPRDTPTWNPRPQETYHPDPQPFTAHSWLDEAKYDMRFALHSENTQEFYCSWTCLTSYLAAEKAIIAWQYNEDSKKVFFSENLSILARSCPEGLRCQAKELQNLTRGLQRMRYLEGGHLPSKAFTKSQATKAMELANQIIITVDKTL